MGVFAPRLALTPALSRARERGGIGCCDVGGLAKSALTPALSRRRERGYVGYC